MEREHPEIHPIIRSEKGTAHFFENALLVISSLGICSQSVLLSVVILVNKDIAISGFSMFFFAIFGIVFLFSVKRANRIIIRWATISAPLLSALISSITLLSLSKGFLVGISGTAIALTISGIPTFPAFLAIKDGGFR